MTLNFSESGFATATMPDGAAKNAAASISMKENVMASDSPHPVST